MGRLRQPGYRPTRWRAAQAVRREACGCGEAAARDQPFFITMSLPCPAGRAARLRRHAFVAALAPAFVLPFPLAAAADPGQRLVVTGTRTPLRIDQALAEVTVIERAQIEAAAGRTLTELLAAQPGLRAWA